MPSFKKKGWIWRCSGCQNKTSPLFSAKVQKTHHELDLKWHLLNNSFCYFCWFNFPDSKKCFPTKHEGSWFSSIMTTAPQQSRSSQHTRMTGPLTFQSTAESPADMKFLREVSSRKKKHEIIHRLTLSNCCKLIQKRTCCCVVFNQIK